MHTAGQYEDISDKQFEKVGIKKSWIGLKPLDRLYSESKKAQKGREREESKRRMKGKKIVPQETAPLHFGRSHFFYCQNQMTLVLDREV